MKRLAKIIGIIALIALSSALLAVMGVVIGSGAASKLLRIPSPDAPVTDTASAEADMTLDEREGISREDISSQTEPEEVPGPNSDQDAAASAQVKPQDEDSLGVIMVGDSRSVGMHDAMVDYEDPFLYIAQSGEGYEWFVEEGLSQMEKAIKNHPSWPVVFNLGVNDTSAVMKYITLYQSFAGRFPNTDFFYLSVNPLTKDSTLVVDEQVVVFNQYLKMAFPETYLDSYSMLKKEGFESADGVHYSDDTYRRIHQFILDELEKYGALAS